MPTNPRRKTKAAPPHHYSADRPILKPQQDRLNRAAFAKALATDLARWEGEDALVMALYGGWGSGKTSLKNLIVNSLPKGQRALEVIDFNPWRLSGGADLSAAFFEELKIKLLQSTKEGQIQHQMAAQKLERYSSRLRFFASLTKIAGGALTLLNPAIGAGALAVGAVASQAAEATDAGARAHKSEAVEADLPLSEIKKQVADELRKLPRPILIIIDDIDRLTHDEIRALVQLVKANADFPNLIFLLLFDREVVAQALDQISGNRGNQFLEKIIQVGYHIPQPSLATLHQVLHEGIEQCLELPGALKRWNQERWNGLFHTRLSSYFQNLRQVHRFLSSLHFHFRHFQKDEYFEVNPVDLIALEILRTFEPALYTKLPRYKHILTRATPGGLVSIYRNSAEEAKQFNDALSTLLKFADEPGRQYLRDCLPYLFTPLRDFDESYSISSNDTEQWLSEGRLCHPAYFDKYFSLAICETELSQIETDRIMALIEHPKDFRLALKELYQKSLLSCFLDRFYAARKNIPAESFLNVLPELCNLAEELPPKYNDDTTTSLIDTIRQTASIALSQLQDPDIRMQHLHAAFEATQAILLPAVIIHSLAPDRDKNHNHKPTTDLLSSKDWLTLRDMVLKRIRNAADEGKLPSLPRAPVILILWKIWEDTSNKEWVLNSLSTPYFAPWFLSTLLDAVESDTGPAYYLRHEKILHYAPFSTFRKALQERVPSALSELETEAVATFLQAAEAHDSGQPEPRRGRTYSPNVPPDMMI